MAFNLPMHGDATANNMTEETSLSFVRYPKNAPGPFYVVNGECMCSGLAPAEAPELLLWDDTGPDVHGNDYNHCYFGRQPETPEETARAIRALAVSDADAIRYGGDDPYILQTLSDHGLGHLADYPIPPPRANPLRLWPRAFAPPSPSTPEASPAPGDASATQMPNLFDN